MPGFRLRIGNPGWPQGLRRLDRANLNIRKIQAKAIKRAALIAEREMKLGLRRSRPGRGPKLKKLALSTILQRKGNSTKPLIDTGDLIGSIHTTYDNRRNAAFVGVHRTARGSDGRSLMNIARIHEFGTKPYRIKVTDRMRKFFFYLSKISGGKIKPLSPSTQFINHPGIPKRPFIEPTLRAIKPEILRKVGAAFVRDGSAL